MPRNNIEPALEKRHRDAIQEALKWLEEARANEQGMRECGFDTGDQLNRIEVAEQAGLAILKHQFGE